MMTVTGKTTSGRRIALCTAILLGLTAGAAAQEKKAPPPATAVGMDTVRSEPLRQTVPVLGRFVAKQAGVVAARVAGAIENYKVEVGDQVAEGDTLATIVADTFEWERNRRGADVATAKAALETSRASQKLLDQELARLEGLKESPAYSQARFDDKHQETVRARSQVTQAQAALRSAEAALQLAEIQLDDTAILAPYGGTVTQRHSEAGAYLRVGDPVIALLDNHNLEIEADVPSNRTAGLTPGRELRAVIDGGTEIKAVVRAVIPDENPRTRTRRARFAVTLDRNADSIMAANQSVTVDIPAGEVGTVLTVHKDAILNRGGGQLVVLNDNGKAAFRPVQLGQAVGERFVVKSGLQDGDVVVIRGNERLRPGQSITDGESAAKKDNPS